MLEGIDDEYTKAVLWTILPDVKSSHRTEALARGLCWRTNTAMRVALAAGSAEVAADEGAFLGYLREHSWLA